jgi:hypothetical protein
MDLITLFSLFFMDTEADMLTPDISIVYAGYRFFMGEFSGSSRRRSPVMTLVTTLPLGYHGVQKPVSNRHASIVQILFSKSL